MPNVRKERLPVVMVIWRKACEHIEQQDSQAVDVDRTAIALPGEHLRSQIGIGSTEGGCAFIVHAFLREPEVCELSVVLLIQDDIVRFEVSEDDPPIMQMTESQNNFSSVKHGRGILESVVLCDQLLQVTVRAILHHQNEAAGRLKGISQRHDEGVMNVGENVPLCLCIALTLPPLQTVLLKHLHRIDLARALVPHLVDFSEGAPAEELDHLEGRWPHEFGGRGRFYPCEGASAVPTTRSCGSGWSRSSAAS
mmetsp:Transcript_7643/g.16752  ORF Transcript_7643/g.16752 Transcript_7643/m.16752 type:complete len:252 (-) Transcript_7643:599-1354(-)